ncbi:vancomycin resistance protein VanW [Pseudarthrobacter sp. PvP004]|uniref:VanW family protein n=1 Tax=Pseudarthrobacter sp. PvP004 TaxID=2817850 RepID=UPI0027DD9BDE|nr:VanW family protein [Pseudarthrobacter sp. PvP004]MBP2269270.1 vancomycin resistance protein VanW [Pseudarthrobacter sp. PvP004]
MRDKSPAAWLSSLPIGGFQDVRDSDFPFSPASVKMCPMPIFVGVGPPVFGLVIGETLPRKLFCEISPFTYRLSVQRMIITRKVRDLFSFTAFARLRPDEVLPEVVYRHNSLIRRKLGNVDLHLQENKAISLGIAAPLVNSVVIRPGETFSFWKLVGSCTEAKGYREGLVINHGRADSGIGGGLCQFTNLLHWMVLHSELTVVEHHHHGDLDLFPDYNRQIPFGSGTSIIYNYLDYRVRNDTDQAYQFLVTTSDEHLRGELRAERAPEVKFHIREEDAYFHEVDGHVYRHNKVMRLTRDKRTGLVTSKEPIIENNALVVYDRTHINAPILDAPPRPENDGVLAAATA